MGPETPTLTEQLGWMWFEAVSPGSRPRNVVIVAARAAYRRHRPSGRPGVARSSLGLTAPVTDRGRESSLASSEQGERTVRSFAEMCQVLDGEGIDNGEARKAPSVLQVLGVETVTSCLQCGRYDECVVEREPVVARD